jgi:hypothetical protein
VKRNIMLKSKARAIAGCVQDKMYYYKQAKEIQEKVLKLI